MKEAIVLGGGGSKGSYELGAWTALLELNVGYQIVTGTSIGAINAALMVQNDYDLARNLWDTITIGDIMADGLELSDSIENLLEQRGDFIPFLKKYIEYKGADITPFISLLNQTISPKKILNSSVDFGLVTVKFPSGKGISLRKKQMNSENMTQFILASASCFPAFPMCKIDGEYYVDGGYYDNLPIDFAFKLGADTILAVDLNYNITHISYFNDPRVTYIKPSWPLGSFLLFDQKIMKANQKLGYNDTMKTFKKLMGYRYTFQKEPANTCSKESTLFSTYLSTLLDETSVKTQKRFLSILDPFLENKIKSPPALSSFDLFLRSAELCAAAVKLDYTEIYRYSSFCKTIFNQFINHIEKYHFVKLFLKLHKMKDLLPVMKEIDQEYLIGCLFRKLLNDNQIDPEFRWISLLIPKESLCALFLFTISQSEKFLTQDNRKSLLENTDTF